MNRKLDKKRAQRSHRNKGDAITGTTIESDNTEFADSEKAIDARYGLEPVFHPGCEVDVNGEPTTFITVQCPYCAESYVTEVDLTAGSVAYVEDCQICCQPIELRVEVNVRGELKSTMALRLD